MTIAWVVGANGLLGSALCRGLKRNGVDVFTPVERFSWGCSAELAVQLRLAMEAFAALVTLDKTWHIYWAAGVGTMNSKEVDLSLETQALSVLLDLINASPVLSSTQGTVAFASSAGAIYAGVVDNIITENTPLAPTTPYANEKIKQESLFRSFSEGNNNVTVLLARMSTLYGPGQAVSKQQGLVAEAARRILRNQSIQIYVPFDTIRDYIFVDDAAALIINTSFFVCKKSGVFVKIIASEKPTTIAEIISVYKRILKRSPRVVVGTNKLTALYNRRIQFQSIYLIVNPSPMTSLFVGISQVIAAERIAFVRASHLSKTL